LVRVYPGDPEPIERPGELLFIRQMFCDRPEVTP
jgi:hypothetical protein